MEPNIVVIKGICGTAPLADVGHAAEDEDSPRGDRLGVYDYNNTT